MKKILCLIAVLALMACVIEPIAHASAPLGAVSVCQTVTGASLCADGKQIYLRGMNEQLVIANVGTATFNPGYYDHATEAAKLSAMHALKYNTVRVSFAARMAMDEDGDELNAAYMANVADYINLAHDNSMYTLIVAGYLPPAGIYRPAANPDFDAVAFNDLMLAPGYAEAKGAYLAAVVGDLVARGAPMDTVVGFEVENEPWFDLARKPFTVAGSVVANSGASYSMSNQKAAMIDAGMIYYLDTVRAAVRAVDPGLLVGIALHSPAAWALNGRYIQTAALVANSQADFIDVHIYPGIGITTDQYMASLGATDKVVVLGEYGAYKNIYPTVAAAAPALLAVGVETCAQYNFDGWLYYDWDNGNVANLWQANENGGYLANALSPAALPDPCLPAAPAPIGHIDSVSPQGVVTGWVLCPYCVDVTTVNFWEGTTFRGTVSCEPITKCRFERPDLALSYSWAPPFPAGWAWKAPAALLTDGQTHTLAVWAAVRNADGTFSSYLIGSVTLPRL